MSGMADKWISGIFVIAIIALTFSKSQNVVQLAQGLYGAGGSFIQTVAQA